MNKNIIIALLLLTGSTSITYAQDRSVLQRNANLSLNTPANKVNNNTLENINIKKEHNRYTNNLEVKYTSSHNVSHPARNIKSYQKAETTIEQIIESKDTFINKK